LKQAGVELIFHHNLLPQQAVEHTVPAPDGLTGLDTWSGACVRPSCVHISAASVMAADDLPVLVPASPWNAGDGEVALTRKPLYCGTTQVPVRPRWINCLFLDVHC
jgi:hypothetical protein